LWLVGDVLCLGEATFGKCELIFNVKVVILVPFDFFAPCKASRMVGDDFGCKVVPQNLSKASYLLGADLGAS
jgi:hypothetical protein